MKEIFDPKFNKILIVIPDQLNPDTVASAIVLSELLKEKGKEVTILGNSTGYLKHFQNHFGSEVVIESKLQSTNFVAQLPNNREIENVEVVKKGDNFEIVLKTKKGKLLDENLVFKQGKINFDLVVLLGLTSRQNSGEFDSNYGKSLTTPKTLSLNYFETDIKTDLKYVLNLSSLSEIIKVYVNKNQYKITPKQASLLLTGIMYATQNLKINTNQQTIKNVHLLVNQDKADLGSVNTFLHGRITNEHVMWFNEIFRNLKVQNNFAYSFVDNETITSEFIGNLNKEDKMPIGRIEGVDVAFVLIRLGKNIHGYIFSKTDKYSVLNLTSEYYQLGDQNFAYFWTDQQIEKIINNIVKKSSTNEQNKQEPVETKKVEYVGEKSSTDVSDAVSFTPQMNDLNKQMEPDKVVTVPEKPIVEEKVIISEPEKIEKKSVDPSSFFTPDVKVDVDKAKSMEFNQFIPRPTPQVWNNLKPQSTEQTQPVQQNPTAPISFVPPGYNPLPPAK